MKSRDSKRVARHIRVRRNVIGTNEKPRLSVHKSLRHFYALLIDDLEQKTLFSFSSLNQSSERKAGDKGIHVATELGKHFATEAKSKGFNQVVFDRGGYLYHGTIKAFAEACRKGGLSF